MVFRSVTNERWVGVFLFGVNWLALQFNLLFIELPWVLLFTTWIVPLKIWPPLIVSIKILMILLMHCSHMKRRPISTFDSVHSQFTSSRYAFFVCAVIMSQLACNTPWSVSKMVSSCSENHIAMPFIIQLHYNQDAVFFLLPFFYRFIASTIDNNREKIWPFSTLFCLLRICFHRFNVIWFSNWFNEDNLSISYYVELTSHFCLCRVYW